MFSKMLSWVKSTILKLLGQESTELTISPKMGKPHRFMGKAL